MLAGLRHRALRRRRGLRHRDLRLGPGRDERGFS